MSDLLEANADTGAMPVETAPPAKAERDPVSLIGTGSLLLIAFVFAFPIVWAALTSF